MHAPPAAAALLLALAALPTEELGDDAPLVRASLLESDAIARRDAPTWLALRLEIEAGWHVYWTYPGDSGLAPTLELDLPDGWTQGPFEWPVPQRHEDGPLVTFVHEGTLVLPFALTPPEGFEGEELEVTGTARWLVCKDVCLPEEQEVFVTLTFGKEQEPGPDAKRVEAARGMVIRSGDVAAAELEWGDPTELLLGVELIDEVALLGAAFDPDSWETTFWPATPGMLALVEPPKPLRNVGELPWGSPPRQRVQFHLDASSRTTRDGLPEGGRGVVAFRPKREGLESAAVWVDLPPIDPAP